MTWLLVAMSVLLLVALGLLAESQANLRAARVHAEEWRALCYRVDAECVQWRALFNQIRRNKTASRTAERSIHCGCGEEGGQHTPRKMSTGADDSA